jgi:hypothetical protein
MNLAAAAGTGREMEHCMALATPPNRAMEAASAKCPIG